MEAAFLNDAAMRKYLAPAVYESLRRTQREGLPLDFDIAQAVAEGMAKWAVGQGATHYTPLVSAAYKYHCR